MLKIGQNKVPAVARQLDKLFQQDGASNLLPPAAISLLFLDAQEYLSQSSTSEAPGSLDAYGTGLASTLHAAETDKPDPSPSESTLAQIISSIQYCKAMLTS